MSTIEDHPAGVVAPERGHDVTIVVPSCNEADNVDAMIDRLDAVFAGSGTTSVLYVDDSTDDTPARVRAAAGRAAHLDVSVLHRDVARGGLAGAVAEGLRVARGRVVVVMDGDLQHPPETLPAVLQRLGADTGTDVVVASRYVPGGSAGGLDGGWRSWVSRSSTTLAKLCFPARLRDCSDPMTGFFAVRADRLDLSVLRPRGFKILLELLVSQPLRVEEVPLVFADRSVGASKATVSRGADYLVQLARLRVRAWSTSRVVRFGSVGALGAVANLLVMAGLMALGVDYVVASVIAGELTVVGGFVAQERVVFPDVVGRTRAPLWSRAAGWCLFNTIELLLRTPLLVLVVELSGTPELVAQALLLVLAFTGRFLFSQNVLYRLRRPVVLPRQAGAPAPGVIDLTAADEVFVSRRPWGEFQQFCLNATVTVKIITVEPGCRLSLQRHEHREEVWQVLDTPMQVQVGTRSWTAQVGERVRIAPSAEHRLGNPGDRAARILEVAHGHFDEADIVRLHDDYARIDVAAAHVAARA